MTTISEYFLERQRINDYYNQSIAQLHEEIVALSFSRSQQSQQFEDLTKDVRRAIEQIATTKQEITNTKRYCAEREAELTRREERIRRREQELEQHKIQINEQHRIKVQSITNNGMRQIEEAKTLLQDEIQRALSKSLPTQRAAKEESFPVIVESLSMPASLPDSQPAQSNHSNHISWPVDPTQPTAFPITVESAAFIPDHSPLAFSAEAVNHPLKSTNQSHPRTGPLLPKPQSGFSASNHPRAQHSAKNVFGASATQFNFLSSFPAAPIAAFPSASPPSEPANPILPSSFPATSQSFPVDSPTQNSSFPVEVVDAQPAVLPPEMLEQLFRDTQQHADDVQYAGLVVPIPTSEAYKYNIQLQQQSDKSKNEQEETTHQDQSHSESDSIEESSLSSPSSSRTSEESHSEDSDTTESSSWSSSEDDQTHADDGEEDDEKQQGEPEEQRRDLEEQSQKEDIDQQPTELIAVTSPEQSQPTTPEPSSPPQATQEEESEKSPKIDQIMDQSPSSPEIVKEKPDAEAKPPVSRIPSQIEYTLEFLSNDTF
ncbi:hypothetical protein BLNAU_22514 [Blattamonas nauphoetae]|uniref:Uncharacterized protein n=1 Tax=Blattamonas nauphoetae TaxID=2049346 RepID=A0ABQ9WSV1_9EUKA|nr:hypothetical protein BLNAU_22514 [Blattamonas nauphoetae]